MVIPANAEDSISFSVSNASARAGGTFTVDVSATNSTSIGGADIRVYYDTSILSCTSVEAVATWGFTTNTVESDGGSDSHWKEGFGYVALGLISSSGVVLNGKLATLTFQVAGDLESCTTKIGADPAHSSVSDSTLGANELSITASDGTVTITGVTPTLDGGTVSLFTDESRETESSDAITVHGSVSSANQYLYAKAVSKGGTIITNDVNWKVTPADQGVTVDATGKVTIGCNAVAETSGTTYTVKAEGKGGSTSAGSGEVTFTVKRDASAVQSIAIYQGTTKLGDNATIIIPASDTAPDNTYTYTVKSTDQYGDEANVGSPSWTFSTADNKVTFDAGTVTVKFGATPNNTYTLTAQSGGKEATVTLTAKNIDITWPTSCTDGKTGTYGQTWQQIVNFSQDGGSAMLDNSPVYGTFTLRNRDTKPAVTDTKYTVNFTSKDGQYNVDKDFTATISPRDISNATIGTIAAETYDGTQKKPTPTVTDSGATITADDYTVSYENNINAGNATVKLTGKNNYTGEKTATFKINSAAITLKDPVAVDAIYANNSSNDTLAALTAYVQSKNAKIQSSDGVVTFDATWSTTDSHVRTGKTYTFTAALSNPTRTLDATGNYDLPAKAPTVTVEVKPVTATPAAFTEAGKTVAKSVITKDDFALSALSLPRQTGAVTYTPAEANVTTGPDVPDKFTVDSWTSNNAAVTAASLKAEAGRVTDSANVDVVMTPVYSDAPAWATLGTAPTYTLTITNKYPVKVTVTAPSDITFGAALGDPSATQVEIDDGTDDSGNASFTYKYVGVEGTTYDSADKPTAAGKYQVVATLVSATHSGTGTSATFTISPKTIEFGDGKDFTAEGLDEDLTYNGSAQELKALVIKDGGKTLTLNTDYTLTYATNTDAGTNTAKVTVTGKGNYGGTPQLTFTIKPFTLTADNTSISGLNTSGYTYTGAAIKPTFSVNTTGFGALTTADYTATYDPTAATAAGDVKITVAGQGNFDGTVAEIATYKIKPAALTGTVTLDLAKGDSNTETDVYEVGDKLTANFSKLSESTEGNLAFQWYNKAGKIETATGKTYEIQENDEEVYVEVSVAEGATSNYAGTVASQKVAVDKKSIPADVTVSITVGVDNGKVTLTAKVTVSSTGATDIAGSFAIQWYRNGAAVGSPITVTESSGSLVDVPYPTDAAAQPAGGEVWTCALVPTAEGAEYTGSVPASSVTNNASSDASASNGDVTIKATAPSAPTNVQATLTKGQTTGSVKVTWGMPTNMNGCELDGWEVTCTPAGGAAVTKKLGASDPREVTFDNLTNGTEYTFTVKALTTTTGITGDASDGVKVTPTAPTPVGPTDPTTPSRPGTGTGSGSGSSSSDDDDDTVTIRSSSRDHGTVRLSSSSARKGDTVTVTVKPDRGYEVDEVLVYSSNGTRLDVRSIGGDEYTFTMPSGTVRVEVTYKRTGSTAQSGFNDVPGTYWAADAIRWVSENGYMMGNTAVTFNPEGRITRQQMWMIMARMAGSNPYDFSDARAWAIANGISDGSNPGNSVTRQQMVAILYRYAQMMDYRTTGGTDLSAFPDSGSVASYAQEALQWSVGNGIVGGTASGTLNPGGTATRAQFATILQRFYANVAR